MWRGNREALYLVPAKSALLLSFLYGVLGEISFERGVLLMFKINTEGLKTALRERTNVDLVSDLNFTTYSAMSS